jgi:uncharacterized membrane protein YdjX (TVP38/TMEM64 family)
VSRIAAIVVVCVAAAVLLAAALWLPVAEWVRAAIAWTRELGALGVVAFAGVFVVASLLVLPTIELFLAAGLLYGTLWGAVLTTALAVIVELLTLRLVHTRLREPIGRRLRAHPRLAALDRGVARQPFWIILLLRLSPVVPFAPLNYALAMAKVPLWKRIVTNVAGMLPTNIVLAYLGSLLSGLHQLADVPAPSLWQHIAVGVGLATAILAALLAARASKRVLTFADSQH